MYKCPKAVTFDLDGTLLDTIEDLANSCNYALEALGHPQHQTIKYLYFVGNGITKLAQRILPYSKKTDENILRCVDLIATHYNNNWNVNTTVYDGIKNLIRSFIDNNVSVNILSNKNELTVQKMVDHFFPEFQFNLVYGATDDFAKKPDPKKALSIAKILGIPPSEFMFIGDSKVDMETAQNSKMTSVGVTWGFRTRQELKDHGAKIIIDKPMDLWNYIKA